MEISVVCAPRPPHPAAIWWLRMSPLRRTHSGSCRHSFAGGGGLQHSLLSTPTNCARVLHGRNPQAVGVGSVIPAWTNVQFLFVCFFPARCGAVGEGAARKA